MPFTRHVLSWWEQEVSRWKTSFQPILKNFFKLVRAKGLQLGIDVLAAEPALLVLICIERALNSTEKFNLKKKMVLSRRLQLAYRHYSIRGNLNSAR